MLYGPRFWCPKLVSVAMHCYFCVDPIPLDQEAYHLPRFGLDALHGLDPDDPAAVQDALDYLRGLGIDCTREEVQELLRKLKDGLLRKWQGGAAGGDD
jgi:hypothetical protein